MALIALSSNGVEGLCDWNAPTTPKLYKDKIKSTVGALSTNSGEDFKVTAFAANSQIYTWTGSVGSNALSALDTIGRGFLRYRARGHGRDQKIGDQRVEASFIDDRDWFHRTKDTDPNSKESENSIPMRAAFGLPHNYHKKYGVIAAGEFDRRASPLLFHVHPIGNCYYPVALFLPTRFLPKNEAAVWKDKQDDQHKASKNYIFNASIIEDYLTGIMHVDSGTGKPASTPYFPSKKIL